MRHNFYVDMAFFKMYIYRNVEILRYRSIIAIYYYALHILRCMINLAVRESWITYQYRDENQQHGDVWVTSEEEQQIVVGIRTAQEYVHFHLVFLNWISLCNASNPHKIVKYLLKLWFSEGNGNCLKYAHTQFAYSYSAKISLAKAPDDDSSVYVILLGISSNSQSAIRYGYGGFDLTTVDTPDLFSPDETRSVSIWLVSRYSSQLQSILNCDRVANLQRKSFEQILFFTIQMVLDQLGQ